MGMISGFRAWLDDMQAPGREHKQRMRRAAGVSSVQLVCHMDTWSMLDAFWTGTTLPRVPKDRVAPKGDMVEVTLSGVHLTALLNLIRDGGRTYVSDAIAKRTYAQVARVVDAVDSEAVPGQPIPPIVLDDKLGETPSSRRPNC
ncbi:hypothetical protein [Nocardia testacea]|uniref:hypothetical protein n=1 Tax=Nocardia testacea TaxID=248551 RepID=UPI0033CF22F2